MNIFTRLIEHWFNLEKEECRSCDHLRLLLEQERAEKSRLLALIIDINSPKREVVKEAIVTPQPIKSSYRPWRVKQAELEAQDRKEAQIRFNQAEELKKLEQEMDAVNKEIENASKVSQTIPIHGNGSPREEQDEEHRAVS